jgi:hypothetical protein
MSAKAFGLVSASLARKRFGNVVALPTSSAKGGPGNWPTKLHEIVEMLEDGSTGSIES